MLSYDCNLLYTSIGSEKCIYNITADIAAPGPIMISEQEHFTNETVTIFLKWTVEENYDTINLAVSPQVIMNVSNGTSAQLILSFNTLYSMSVTANICGRNFSSSKVNIHYGKALHHPSSFFSLTIVKFNY